MWHFSISPMIQQYVVTNKICQTEIPALFASSVTNTTSVTILCQQIIASSILTL
jgi:hypothetical protein